MLEIRVVSVSFAGLCRSQIEQVIEKPSASFQQQLQRIGAGLPDRLLFGTLATLAGFSPAGVEPQGVDGLKVEGRWLLSSDEQLSQLQQSEGQFNT